MSNEVEEELRWKYDQFQKWKCSRKNSLKREWLLSIVFQVAVILIVIALFFEFGIEILMFLTKFF